MIRGLMAHRGASKAAPENTRAAFELAVAQGARTIELDVHLTADERLVVIHDATIDRTSDGTGAVSEMTLADLRAFRYDRTHPGAFAAEAVGILEFADAVAFMVEHDLDLNVETKSFGADAARVNDLVAATVEDAGWMPRTLVSSINHGAVAAFAVDHPDALTAIAFVERFVDVVDYARRCGARVLHPHHRLVDEEFVARAHAAGLRVNAWTVDDEHEAARILALGVDGLMTNRPDMRVEATS